MTACSRSARNDLRRELSCGGFFSEQSEPRFDAWHVGVVQRWLGHSSITTSERYGHLAPGAGDSYVGLLSFRGDTDALGAPVHENRANLVPTRGSETTN